MNEIELMLGIFGQLGSPIGNVLSRNDVGDVVRTTFYPDSAVTETYHFDRFGGLYARYIHLADV